MNDKQQVVTSGDWIELRAAKQERCHSPLQQETSTVIERVFAADNKERSKATTKTTTELGTRKTVVKVAGQASGSHRRSKGSSRLTNLSRLVPLLRYWLPVTLKVLLCHWPVGQTRSDDTSTLSHPFTAIADVSPDLEDQLNAQLSQQRTFDYLVHNQENNQHHQYQQQQRQLQEEETALSEMMRSLQMNDDLAGLASQPDQQQANEANLNQAQLVEDLLESQSANTISNPSPTSSSTGSTTASPPSPQQESTAAKPSTNLLGDQLGAVSNLLQQIGQSAAQAAVAENLQSGQLSESIINGVSNSILGPIRSQTAAMSEMVRKTVNANRMQNQQQPASPKPQVGQSIDGNIEYDSNQNSINGWIEFPSFGNGSKPSLSSIKPYVMTALKTVPIKLGTVGWKLLQLIAWKKIYKTHHPKSGEIVIEQEMKTKESPSKSYKSAGKSMSMDLDMKHPQAHKISKMGQAHAGMGYGHMMRPFMQPVLSHGHPGWHYGPMDGSPAMGASMVYQRHLLPPQASQSISTHPATAAAAAAAATAAAIQSQWAQNQLAADESSENQVNVRPNKTVSALQRKRSSLGGNWFATPAHAYAAAAAAANAAATAASVSQQQHVNPVYRYGLSPVVGQRHPFEANTHEGFQQALTGFMYQNLFDNAAAMAVQNAVKLPPSGSMDYLEQADSLSGGSMSSVSDVDAWASGPGGLMLRPRSGADSQQELGAGIGDSLLGLNDPDSQVGQNSLSISMTDFDDTPAGKFIDAALNESAAYSASDFSRMSSDDVNPALSNLLAMG